MDDKKKLEDKDMEKVVGGEATSANIVGYGNNPQSVNEVPNTENWNTSNFNHLDIGDITGEIK